MNKILYLLLFFSILYNNNIQAQAKKLLGIWKIQTVDGKEPGGGDKDIQLSFFNNGDFEFFDGKDTDKGSWKLLKDKKTIKISGLEMGPSETITIVEISKKSVSLDNEGSVAIFEKIGKTKRRKKQKTSRKLKKVAKQLHGCWKVVELIGVPSELKDDMKALEIYIQFNKDNSLWMQEPNRGIVGSWSLVNEKMMSIEYEGRTEQSSFFLKNDTLELSDNGRAGFRLIRSDKKIKKPEMDKEESLEEEPFDPQPDVVTEAPLYSNSDVVGKWKVLKMDGDDMNERNIQFEITDNGSFDIMEDGESIRAGTWKINSSSQLYIKDKAGYSNNYTIKLAGNNKIMLSDYYGEIEMIRE